MISLAKAKSQRCEESLGKGEGEKYLLPYRHIVRAAEDPSGRIREKLKWN
jgi:hypothetical protein